MKPMIRKILNSYRSQLERENIRPVKLILYGSFAHGQPHQWSDIDVVVIARSYGKRTVLERMEFLSQKAAEVDDRLEVLGYTEKEYQAADQSIFKEIITQGQVV